MQSAVRDASWSRSGGCAGPLARGDSGQLCVRQRRTLPRLRPLCRPLHEPVRPPDLGVECARVDSGLAHRRWLARLGPTVILLALAVVVLGTYVPLMLVA